MVNCQRCEQPVPEDRQHANTEECFKAMRTALGGARLALAISRDKIQQCRNVKHVPNRIIALGKTTVCRDCLALGFAAFQAITQLIVDGAVRMERPPLMRPDMRLVLPTEGAAAAPGPVAP